MIIASVGITACGNPYMSPVDPMAINTSISQDEATIVFFRPSKFWGGGSALQIATIPLGMVFSGAGKAEPIVLEVEENVKPKYITVLCTNGKFLHKTTPGKHLYTAAGDNFLETNLEAGKAYYAYVLERFGGLRPQFILLPATASELSSEEFRKAFAKCDWYENKPYGQKVFDANRDNIEKHLIEKYYTSKPEDKVLMLPEYGTDTPIR